MLPDKFKSMLRGPRAQPVPPAAQAQAQAQPRSHFSGAAAAVGAAGADAAERSSRGLEEFFKYIRETSGLTILDLGPATQANISFITNLGHRIYTGDFLQILHDTFDGEDAAGQSNPGQIEYFLKQALDYPDGHFDGVLIWDVLEYLAPPLLTAVVERLHRIVRPRSYLLSFFHADDKQEAVPYYTFRIQSISTLQVARQGRRRPAQLFNNRSLEKVFGKFESVKFFLTKERLREVIVKA